MGSDRRSASRKHVSDKSRTVRPVHEPGSCSTSQTSNAKENSWKDWWPGQCWFYFIKRPFFSSRSFVVYVFEDKEAVIKMIIKGRSPRMRHVSRTLRGALDWLLDRINLDPKIQIKYIDTKNPTRRYLNKGKFHTWWMESSFVFVQHQPFQFHQ